MGTSPLLEDNSYSRLQERYKYPDETIWWMTTVQPFLLVAFFKWLGHIEKMLPEDKSLLKYLEPFFPYIVVTSAVLYFADERGPLVPRDTIHNFSLVLGQLKYLDADPNAIENLLGVISNHESVKITFPKVQTSISTELFTRCLEFWVEVVLHRKSWDKDKGLWLKVPENFNDKGIHDVLPKKIEIDNWYLSFALGAFINLEDSEAVRAYYEEHGNSFEHTSDMILKTKVMNKAWKLMTEHVDVGKVLDLGAGTGLAQQTKPDADFNLIGIDFAHTMATQAQGNGEEVVQANALEQPFAENTFEGVLCCYFEHYFDTEGKVELLEETRRVLATDGYLVMTVRYPSKDWRAIYKDVLLKSGLKPISFRKETYSGTHTKKYTIGFIVAQKL